MKEHTMNKCYALAIRRRNTEEGESPVIIIRRSMSLHEARRKADEYNRDKMPECRALGGECFVAYNLEAV